MRLEIYLKFVKMDPFRLSIKITSMCNKVFRTMFLKPDTLGIIPRGAIARETASLLRFFNGWCILVEQGTM